jgi:hypothetical protein
MSAGLKEMTSRCKAGFNCVLNSVFKQFKAIPSDIS